ncbi:MAG: DegV family protein [Eubacteriales bacterium]|nr:DegV family protein [Eubacteriales bacterium]
MSKIAVITDSNSGILPQEAAERGIRVVPMPFTIDDETYYEGINLTREEFYQHMEEGAAIATSQPSPEEVMKIWDEALETNDEIVYIPMSSGLSGSCQSALMLSDDYDGRVQVVNNQRISVTQKRSVLDALDMAEHSMTAAEIKAELERVKMESSIYIMLDTLKYLKKGGRITPAAAAIGALLRIKPVLQIKGERLDAFSKARTLAQGKNIMIGAMKHDIETLYGGLHKENVWLYAVHGYVPAQFAEFSQEVRNAFPAFNVEDDMLSLSVACHIGPGALAIACSKKI